MHNKQKKQTRGHSTSTKPLPEVNPYLDYGKLLTLQQMLCGNIEEIFAELGVSVERSRKMFIGPCPIHGGDNPNALNLYRDGESVPGYWRCWTHHCEEVFKRTVIGFVRGVLSRQRLDWSLERKKMVVSWKDAVDWCCDLFKTRIQDVKSDSEGIEKQRFSAGVAILTRRPEESQASVTRPIVRSRLEIPSRYFVERGWSAEVLDRYDVGLCSTPGQPMHNRVVVPVYDPDYTYMVGCTARSIHGRCPTCGLFHASGVCPPRSEAKLYSKWRNSRTLHREHHLYNYWFAKKHIQKSKIVCLCEGPGDVWRLEEADIHVGLGMFGTDLSDQQQVLLETSGAMNVVVLTNNDAPGREAAEKLKRQLGRCFRVHTPTFSAHDLGEMRPGDVRSCLIPILQQLQRNN